MNGNKAILLVSHAIFQFPSTFVNYANTYVQSYIGGWTESSNDERASYIFLIVSTWNLF